MPVGASTSAADTSDVAFRGTLIFPLHGIRTDALWQREFSDICQRANLFCVLAPWYFGHFSLLRFLLPSPRAAKVEWFDKTYSVLRDQHDWEVRTALPSAVAHSFGTYILGNALLKYPHLRFDKILLCASILPRDYPWADLIARRQVRLVRNEYGARDRWARLVPWFVAGTGTSGYHGFDCRHVQIEQEAFTQFQHSDYFSRGHMRDNWIPFLKRQSLPESARDNRRRPTADAEARPPAAAVSRPWGLYLAYMLVLGFLPIVLVSRPSIERMIRAMSSAMTPLIREVRPEPSPRIVLVAPSDLDVSIVPAGPPAQFIVRGLTGGVPPGRTLWAGVKTGQRFWPLVELVANAPDGKSFEYRVVMPPGIASAVWVVIKAGPAASKLFAERLVTASGDGSVDWTHLLDIEQR